MQTWIVKQLCQQVKRDREQNVVRPLRDGQNLNKFLKRKAELAVKGENLLSKDYTKLKQKWSSKIERKRFRHFSS